MKAIIRNLIGVFCLVAVFASGSVFAQKTQRVDALTFDGSADSNGGNIVITAKLDGSQNDEEEAKRIYSVDAHSIVTATAKQVRQQTQLTLTHKHGELKELVLNYSGDLEIDTIEGAKIEFWSVRHLPTNAKEKGGVPSRQLILSMKEPVLEGKVVCTIKAIGDVDALPSERSPLLFSNAEEGFLSGGIEVQNDAGIRVDIKDQRGMLALKSDDPKLQKFRIAELTQNLVLGLSATRYPPISFTDFNLEGSFQNDGLRFVLTGSVESFYDQEYRVALLSGDAAGENSEPALWIIS